MITLDLIIPIYNEEEVLPHLLSELKQTFGQGSLTANQVSQVHYIFIDDGSRDASSRIILTEIQNGFLLSDLESNVGQS